MHFFVKAALTLALASSSTGILGPQSTGFTIEGRPVQIHGFASRAFEVSDGNNYLTMSTRTGSFSFTDFGVNISAELTAYQF